MALIHCLTGCNTVPRDNTCSYPQFTICLGRFTIGRLVFEPE